MTEMRDQSKSRYDLKLCLKEKYTTFNHFRVLILFDCFCRRLLMESLIKPCRASFSIIRGFLAAPVQGLLNCCSILELAHG
jgi:hypothetical protein